jgi:hypothetical protein
MMRAHFLLVEAERYRHLADRVADPGTAARYRRIAAEYEGLVSRYNEYLRKRDAGEPFEAETRAELAPAS